MPDFFKFFKGINSNRINFYLDRLFKLLIAIFWELISFPFIWILVYWIFISFFIYNAGNYFFEENRQLTIGMILETKESYFLYYQNLSVFLMLNFITFFYFKNKYSKLVWYLFFLTLLVSLVLFLNFYPYIKEYLINN